MDTANIPEPEPGVQVGTEETVGFGEEPVVVEEKEKKPLTFQDARILIEMNLGNITKRTRDLVAVFVKPFKYDLRFPNGRDENSLEFMKTKKEIEGALGGVLRNVKLMKRISFDIGQTIVKIAYAAAVPKRETSPEGQLLKKKDDAIHLHCIQTRIEDFEAVLDFIAKEGNIKYKTASFMSTYQTIHWERMIEEKLGVTLCRSPFMESLVQGTNFLMRNIEDESFVYDHHNESCKYQFTTFRPADICPYLLVNVGTGISVFRVDSDENYERVGGSTLGGGAFFGIAQLLTEDMEHDLDDLLKMAEDGDHRQIDTLVSDIYGDGLEVAGLSADIIAGSFGKCSKRATADQIKESHDYRKNAVRSLLLMISNSIGQLAVLYAQKENVRRIYFDGFLIRNHGIIMRTISYSIKFWSQGQQQAHFLRHEGYTAAIGAYLHGGRFFEQTESVENGVGAEGECLSWHEYYRGCSELGRFVPTAPLSAGFTAGVLELEFSNMSLLPFPLLAEGFVDYKPDVVNLNLDAEDREYWLKIMEDSVNGVMAKAVESQKLSESAHQRAAAFKEDFLRQISLIREKSFAYGSCTTRNLLDLREQLLNEYEFDDCYLWQKKKENEMALLELPSVLKAIDKVQDWNERFYLVSKGILAGNVFDWGAKKVVEMMEAEGGLSFNSALDKIPDRPWHIDNFEEFKAACKRKSYKCAAIFVDNSGFDFFLGVLPFAREMAKNDTKVIIVCNLKPALNDLTYKEMISYVDRLKATDLTLKYLIERQLLCFSHSGQSSPCLDLRRVNSELNTQVVEEKVDLVILEGMGRALHTNLNAKFTCDSLKTAVIKSQWLADKMGGDIFSVVFKFERGTKTARRT